MVTSLSLLAVTPALAGTAESVVETTRIRVGDMVFDARVAGPSDGELVVLLHGFPQTSFAFRRQLEWLGAAGFRAVAPDQRGYSVGARPVAIEDYRIGALVSDVVGIADALGRRRFHLVGHDWGGAVSWVLALRHPERLLSLAVLSTPHVGALASARANPESDQTARSAYFSDLAAPDAEMRLLADDAAQLRSVFDPSVFAPDEIQAFIDVLGTPDALRGALNWYRALTAPSAPASAPANAPTRSPVAVPTLYVWGDADSAFGRDAAEATARFAPSPYRFVALEGIGHWILEQSPERIDALLAEHLETARAAESSELSTMELSEPLVSAGRLGGVTLGPEGAIYVANFSNTVWKVSPGGEVEVLARGFQGSSGNALDRDGHLLQASFLDGRLVRIAPNGEQTTLVAEGLEGPVGVLANDDGTVFICNCRGASIARLDIDGKLSTWAAGELFACPNGITIGPRGNVYIVNMGNGHIIRITPEGNSEILATLPGESNAHIAYARDSLFVTQIGANRIYRVFLDGRFEPFAGNGEAGLDDGPLRVATLSRPNGIAASPDGSTLIINNLKGMWRGDERTEIVLRRIALAPFERGGKR